MRSGPLSTPTTIQADDPGVSANPGIHQHPIHCSPLFLCRTGFAVVHIQHGITFFRSLVIFRQVYAKQPIPVELGQKDTITDNMHLRGCRMPWDINCPVFPTFNIDGDAGVADTFDEAIVYRMSVCFAFHSIPTSPGAFER